MLIVAHINNLYNTCFWALVHSGLSTKEANATLQVRRPIARMAAHVQGTESKDKNEMLFSRFGLNYNALPDIFRKGSTIARAETRPTTTSSDDPPDPDSHPSEPSAPNRSTVTTETSSRKSRPFDGLKGFINVLHIDIIRDPFWAERPWLLR